MALAKRPVRNMALKATHFYFNSIKIHRYNFFFQAQLPKKTAQFLKIILASICRFLKPAIL
jgi:hypothetical protein